MTVIRPAVLADLPGLSAVLAEAFSVKMHVLFGRDPVRTSRLLQTIYRGPVSRGYDGVIVAEQDGAIVGGLVIEPMPWLRDDVNRLDTAIATELSPWRQLWNRIGFAVFQHGPEPGDAYITDVCVRKDQRGRGIAQKLMAYAEEWARQNGRFNLTLWVAAGNTSARHVYEKLGMVKVGQEIGLISGLLFGVPRWVKMSKRLR
jgi:ribosomal protein S18 acetylase RimI-like enzyme